MQASSQTMQKYEKGRIDNIGMSELTKNVWNKKTSSLTEDTGQKTVIHEWTYFLSLEGLVEHQVGEKVFPFQVYCPT